MKYLLLSSLLFFSLYIQAQFKGDNVKYTTVFPQDLCKVLQQNPGYLLLDVRSKGEYDDTSSSPGLNIGHIKGSTHIDIRQLPARWKELLAYKEKPIFIYCSHSQRSRRASRLLADSGFTKVFNVNEGLTGFYLNAIDKKPCAEYTIGTSLAYQLVSPAQLVKETKNKKEYVLIDIREDSVYKGISRSEEQNVEGRFEGALHIPLSAFAGKLSSIPQNKPLLILDTYGSESPKAAKQLIENGYKDVSILFNGMDEWVDYITSEKKASPLMWKPGASYRIVAPEEFIKWTEKNTALTLIDVRTQDEFNNQSKNNWQNIGQIKNAINIPSADLNTRIASLPSSKDAQLLIYGFSNNEYVYAAAKSLQNMGYKNVSVLRGGIWNLRWLSHNQAGKSALSTPVINIPEENL